MDRFAASPPIEERAADRLRAREESLAIAETCTGGLVTALLTGVPGASAYLDRAFVPYGNDALRTELGVAREPLDANGVVSPAVTEELARRARDRADADWGLSTTGIAGPTGGTPEKPVGTSHVGVAYAAPWASEDSYATAETHEFEGDRGAVRERIAREALSTLADHLAAVED